MKRVLVLAIIVLAILAIPPTMNDLPNPIDREIIPPQGPNDIISVASASGSGNVRSAVQFASRKVNNLVLPITNSFSSPSVHTGVLDFSSYLVSGWSLYQVDIDVNVITAASEFESLNVNPSTYIIIRNDTTGTHLTTDALYQEFYNQLHDGKLENYTIKYLAPFYDSASLGSAHLVVRSNFSDPQTNTTGWISPFIQTTQETLETHDCSSDNAILNASTPYYVVIDGTGMQAYHNIPLDEWYFNKIYWSAQPILGLDTGGRIRDYPAWYSDGIPDVREAELNYTYTPWNKTTNSALTYGNPNQVSMKGNLSDLQSTSWTFTDADNISLINFEASQSVEVDYNITLWYKQSVSTTTSWTIPTSGADVEWSVETTIEFPENTQSKYLNISISETWDPESLYNSTHTTSNHTSFSSTGSIITCSQMYNDSWTLELTSENLMKTLKTYTAVDDTEVVSQSLMTSNIDINSTLQEPDSDPITSGTVSLEIWHSGSEFWTPSDKSVTNGFSHYLWDISNPLADNGEYTIETYWSNGTEAGYRTKDLLLYYPTTLVAFQSQIDAFTESAFDISVDFDDSFTPQGLDAGFARVEYSFDGGTNTSLTDSGGGTWIATIPTTGKVNDTYTVVVYAEGYALENRSITLYVTLIHDTQPLVINWSNTNNISYVGSTILSVEYRTVGGSPVTGATINITDGSTWWELTHVGSGIYNYTFNGANPDLDFITHDLTIQAWQMGYKNQSDATTLTVHRESTTIDIIWIDGSSITFVEVTTLRVNYTMSDGSAVLGADINVTIGTGDWNLVWNGATQTYNLTISGDAAIPGFGNHSVNLFVGRFGYINHTDNSETLSIDLEPTSILIDWLDGNGTITYVQQTTLVVTFRMNNLTPISGAVVNATDGVTDWEMEWDNPSQTYRVTLFGWNYTQGLGSFNLTIRAIKTGHVESTGNITLTISEDPTTIAVSWSSGIHNITYIERTTLIVSYMMNDTTPIDNATVIARILGVPYPLSWHNDSLTYRYNFTGADSPPGFGTFNLTISAYKFGFEKSSNTDHWITLRLEPTSIDITWIDTDTITYLESTILAINYTMQDGSPVTGANVTVAIGSDSWLVDYDNDSKTYRLQFFGTDEPPGLGAFTLDITASIFGFETRENNTVDFTINLEPTSLVISWNPDNDITFATYSILYVDYTLLNSTSIPFASVNLTIDTDYWEIPWNVSSQRYQLRINGSDIPPGFGNHSIFVQASKKGYGYLSSNDTVLLRIEPTSLIISWSNGNDPGFYGYTYLFANYRMNNLTTIRDAELNVTIGTDFWRMEWNETAGMYQVRFNGSDYPPGVGTHDLTIQAWKRGYIPQVNNTETLILPLIPTMIDITWTNSNTITFLGQTTLFVNYTMYNGTAIYPATVYITIGVALVPLDWNSTSKVYEHTFLGTDSPPGLGSQTAYISAWDTNFEPFINIVDSFTINKEPTSLVITWSNSNNITYVTETRLSVRYQASGLNITDAILNVTINGQFQDLIWNSTSQAYEATIRGDDDPPGYHTHTVVIQAWKFGFVSILDSNQNFTIRLEDTSVSYEWSPNSTITYLGQTTISISYLMGNSTPIPDAIVNITRGPTTWNATWNDTSKAYEYTWLGIDELPGIGSHLLTVKAWKVNYIAIVDTSEILTIDIEPTIIQASWSDGNSISFVGWTTLLVNYTTSTGLIVPFAYVDVTIGTYNWGLDWNATSKLWEITFRNGTTAWPGLGTHGLSIRGSSFLSYETAVNNNQTLTINSEQVDISSVLLGGDTITYVGYTTLAVNYTTSEGDPILGAMVNVTISGTLWNLTWDAGSETYRIRFNGSDDTPGLGYHNLLVNASAFGFDSLTDSTQFLTINKETTSMVVYWGAPNYNNVTYFDYTILFVEYKMNSNDTVIQGATVNVTDGTTTWELNWSSAQGAYYLRFNGSDILPGLGIHSLTIKAGRHGFYDRIVSDITLILSKDPTTLVVSWVGGDDISYVEQTTLSVTYKMSNGSDISWATVNATIEGEPFVLSWNATTGAFEYQFAGNQDPPGLGNFTVYIQASADVYEPQTYSSMLTIQNDVATATPSWPTYTFDWTESAIFSVDFKDSHGSLIEDATTKSVYINGKEYVLFGTNGTYWIKLNNTFDLGLHNVWANFSKFGFDPVAVLSITFTITEAPTALTITWTSKVIDYLGNANLTVDYYYVGTNTSVPSTGVQTNITIDGSLTLPMTLRGNVWVANLTGTSLDLGVHNIEIRAWVYGYKYNETLEVVTVNQVTTDALVVTWDPSNITIEYTDSLDLTVDYTYYGGDVPSSATMNVSISDRLYLLVYSGGLWSTSIPGEELGIGLHTATVSAWLYGYYLQTNVTVDINVTLAANMFLVTWEPWDLDASYVDIVNATVIYLQDFLPILDATVQLTINGTPYLLAYSNVTEMWHFSMHASDIGLGIWNVTVTANKTGYADGWDSIILSISPAFTNLTVVPSTPSIYYDEDVTIDIYYQLLNTSFVPGAILTLEVDGSVEVATWDTDHWTITLSGSYLGLGNHPIYTHVVAFGFEDATNTTSIDVTAIPTSVITPAPSVSIFAYETTTIAFTWTDDKNSMDIAGYVPVVTWPDAYSIVDHGDGTYSVTIHSMGLHVGNYELQVDFVRTGYVNGTQLVNIELLEIPIVLVFDDEIRQFENETIWITIEMFDGPHAAVVDWAEIIIELDGVQYTLLYDYSSGLDHYYTAIWLDTLEPGFYNINITASAVDCETESGVIQLEIIPKIEYTLLLEVDEEVQAGQSTQITILVSYESGSLEDFQVTVHIVVERGELAPQEVIEVASDLLEFNVPYDATALTIWAEFEGSIGEWPATSNVVNREVAPGVFDILSFIFSLFENPVTLTIIVGGGGGSLAGLILLRRRRGSPKVSKPIATDTLAPPSTTPAAPTGEMDIVQDVIKKNPDGMTRAQIAQSLEISTSKASVMVKKLLDSDSGFEEIKEGRLRRIRFNPEG